MKVLVIGSVYPRFHEDAEVPWLRTSIAHLKKAGLGIQVLAPAYKGLRTHEIDGVKVNRFRYAPASWEILTHEEGAPSKMASRSAPLSCSKYRSYSTSTVQNSCSSARRNG